jgi:hypothetical protein
MRFIILLARYLVIEDTVLLISAYRYTLQQILNFDVIQFKRLSSLTGPIVVFIRAATPKVATKYLNDLYQSTGRPLSILNMTRNVLKNEHTCR